MAFTSLEVEFDSDSSSVFKEEDGVFSKLSRSDIVQDLMGRCQDKSKHMKIFKKKYDLLKKELNSIQNKNDFLENDHISLVKECLINLLMIMKWIFKSLS